MSFPPSAQLRTGSGDPKPPVSVVAKGVCPQRQIDGLRSDTARNDSLNTRHTSSRHRPRRRAIQYSRDANDGIKKPQRTGYPLEPVIERIRARHAKSDLSAQASVKAEWCPWPESNQH